MEKDGIVFVEAQVEKELEEKMAAEAAAAAEEEGELGGNSTSLVPQKVTTVSIKLV